MAVAGKSLNVRSMLLQMGVDSYLADMAIPYMWFIPGAVDPDAQGVIETIQGLQRGLRRLGFNAVAVSGVMDRPSAEALDQLHPPVSSWMQTPWVQLYGCIIDALANPRRKAHIMKHTPMGDYFQYHGPAPGPLPGVMVGTPPGPLGMGATAVDLGTSLEFGPGRDKRNMIPVPRRSGTTYETFKCLQRDINRMLSHTRTSPKRIDEDGVVGPQTTRALVGLEPHFGQSLGGKGGSANVAQRAATLAAKLGMEADRLQISRTANPGSPTSVVSIKEPEPVPITPPELTALVARHRPGPWARYAPYALAAGLLAWWASSLARKKRRA